MRAQELEVKSQNYWLTVAELRKAHHRGPVWFRFGGLGPEPEPTPQGLVQATTSYSSITKTGSICIQASFTASSLPSRYPDLKHCNPPNFSLPI